MSASQAFSSLSLSVVCVEGELSFCDADELGIGIGVFVEEDMAEYRLIDTFVLS